MFLFPLGIKKARRKYVSSKHSLGLEMLEARTVPTVVPTFSTPGQAHFEAKSERSIPQVRVGRNALISARNEL